MPSFLHVLHDCLRGYGFLGKRDDIAPEEHDVEAPQERRGRQAPPLYFFSVESRAPRPVASGATTANRQSVAIGRGLTDLTHNYMKNAIESKRNALEGTHGREAVGGSCGPGDSFRRFFFVCRRLLALLHTRSI